MAGLDRLFVYRVGFEDHGTEWFCPYSAQVIGYLAYYPAVRATLDVVELDFAKPRHPLVDLVGEANQAAPCLVLAAPPPTPPHAIDGVTISSHEGHYFVSKTIEILRYLAATRGTNLPH